MAGTGTAAVDKGPIEYGSGDYAVIITTGVVPRRYCWFIEETVRICRGSSTKTDYVNSCIDDETSCLQYEPEGSTKETSSCYVRVSYETVSNGALYGDCKTLDAYWGDDPAVDCLYHKYCGGGQKCIDYKCQCPKGATCAPPPAPGPAPQ